MVDMKEVKMSNIQLGMLTLGFLYGSIAIINPVIKAKRDGWLALILGFILGYLLILMYMHISRLHCGKTMTEILESCFGAVLGKMIIALYILFFIYKAVINTRGFGEFMAIVSYPETPLYFLMGTFILAAVYVARSGLATIGRISEILVPLIPIPVLLVSASIITMKNYSGFEPVLLEILPVIKSMFSTVSTSLGDFVVFLMILPYTNNEKSRLKAATVGILSLFFLMMLIVVRNLIVIGPVLIEHFSYPAHVASQLIPGISIDPLVDVNLLLGGGFKVAVFIYAAAKATAELFGIDNHEPFVCSFAVLIMVLAFWIVPDAITLRRWSGSISVILFTVPYQILFPFVIYIISIIKRPKEKKSH